jgi:hypothetical protein
MLDAGGDLGRFRPGKQPRLVQLSGSCRHRHRDLPTADLPPLAHRGVGECQPQAVVVHARVPSRLRHQVPHEVLLNAWLRPIRVQGIGRAHDRTAAPLEPFFLVPANGVGFRRHLRDLPTELDPARVTLLEFRPHRFRPVTSRRNDFQVVSDFCIHDLSPCYCRIAQVRGKSEAAETRLRTATLQCASAHSDAP